MSHLAEKIARQFASTTIKQIVPLGNGLINDTFLVTTEQNSFVLQRINTQVFPSPELIMENLSQLNKHLNQTSQQTTKLQIPNFIKTQQQQDFYIDSNADFWRCLEFIAQSYSKETINNLAQASQVGFALGHFHQLFHHADTHLFHDTLPGFHITPSYFSHYQAIKPQQIKPSPKTQYCQQFIDQFKPKIHALEQAKHQGLLVERITHGDPKLNNFLFDHQTDKIISLIDLDTVKPGLVHYDIADCLRSCCHVTESNIFDLELCKIILDSYLAEVKGFFSLHDYDFLYLAIELIPFELGLRFFTDYLEGNKYFKVDTAEQNLDRAWSQFQLCKNIAKQEAEIRLIISKNIPN